MTQSDGYLCLSDHKLRLGEVGVEQGNILEVYYPAAGIWDAISWDTPIHVGGKNQKCLVHYQGIVQMPFLNGRLPLMKDE